MATEIETEFIEESSHLMVVAQGDWEPEAIRQFLERVKAKAVETNKERIVIDAYDVRPPKNNAERFEAGKVVGELLAGHYRVAVIYPSELITKASENAALNRGAKFLACSTEDEALHWILND